MAVTEKQISSLLDHLPAVFQEDREPGKPNFLGTFLLAFERILLGLGETSDKWPQPGLEETIGGGSIRFLSSDTAASLAGLQRYFDPGFIIVHTESRTDNIFLPENECVPGVPGDGDFLPWLAGWLALTLRQDWGDSRDQTQQRELIAKASLLYQLRGTRKGMEEFLKIYKIDTSGGGIVVDEQEAPFQVGVSRVGVDTRLDGGAPFYFSVRIWLQKLDLELKKKYQEIATAVIELQKPAHTFYTLTVDTPKFQINVNSTVGVDTLLGGTETV